MKNNISKEQVEKLVGHAISDARFGEALECVARKQACAYENEKNPVVLQDWYLAKLTEECVRSLAFSEFTMELYKELRNMEKSACPKDMALTHNHIVTFLE
jgi:hypothetical protein